MHKRARQRGFTLMELMVTVAMVGILIAIAAPSLRGSIERSSVQSKVRELRATLADARSTAVTRNVPVLVCASDDGASCAGDWNEGWLSFADADGDAAPSDDEILKAYGGFQDNTTITVSDSPIAFAADGTLNAAAAIDIKLCPGESENPLYARGVVVQLSGVVRHSRDSNDDAVHEDSTGTAYACP